MFFFIEDNWKGKWLGDLAVIKKNFMSSLERDDERKAVLFNPLFRRKNIIWRYMNEK